MPEEEAIPSVRTELRGDVCVFRCGGVDGRSLAVELPGEVGRCLGSGIAAGVVDLDPWRPLGGAALAALRDAARAFTEAGAALVVAVEEPEAREELAGAGLMRAVPPTPGPSEADGTAPVGSGEHPRWEHEFSFPATTRRLQAARRRVAAFAEVAGLDEVSLFELNIAVAEALANAVVHGSPNGADDDVHVRFFCYEDEVAVEVVDCGAGLDATPICAPPAAATSGRGIHFMRALADAVHYTCGPLGTRVLLIKERS
ncbi:MAG TPA: ATP-binding protein [Thermoleophilia bacterium]|nr:ATP-binding protein [Thermoleophilia bacterium]